jgi:hypothetical protein
MLGGLLMVAALVWVGVAAVARYAPHAVPKPPDAKDADGPQGWLMGGLGPATLQEEIAHASFMVNLPLSCGLFLVGGTLVALSFRRPRS